MSTWYWKSLRKRLQAYGYGVAHARGVLQTVDDGGAAVHQRGVKVEQIPADGGGVAARVVADVLVRPPGRCGRRDDYPLRRSLPHLPLWTIRPMSRDSHNSRPAVFTRIDMQGTGGQGRRRQGCTARTGR